ncbi:hypothetical protein CRUP_036138 [Coryphaenoides rupestris]|nr:hypothetical protein CRUP_036138 [Coryphaenoides rupestris]
MRKRVSPPHPGTVWPLLPATVWLLHPAKVWPLHPATVWLLRGCCSRSAVTDPCLLHLQPRGGVEKGPDLIRSAGLVKRLRAQGCVVTDYGNLCLEDVPDDEPAGRVKRPRAGV